MNYYKTHEEAKHSEKESLGKQPAELLCKKPQIWEILIQNIKWLCLTYLKMKTQKFDLGASGDQNN